MTKLISFVDESGRDHHVNPEQITCLAQSRVVEDYVWILELTTGTTFRIRPKLAECLLQEFEIKDYRAQS